jgi:hypothetical protein
VLIAPVSKQIPCKQGILQGIFANLGLENAVSQQEAHEPQRFGIFTA